MNMSETTLSMDCKEQSSCGDQNVLHVFHVFNQQRALSVYTKSQALLRNSYLAENCALQARKACYVSETSCYFSDKL